MQILGLGLLGIIPRQILQFQSWTVTYTAVLLTHSCTHNMEILYRAACVYICHCPSLLWTICHLTCRLQHLRDFKAHICHNTEWKKTVNDRSSSDQWFRAAVSKTYFLFWIVLDCSGTNVSLYFLDLMRRGTACGFHKCSRDWMSGQDVLRRQRVARWVITKTRGLCLSSLSISSSGLLLCKSRF